MLAETELTDCIDVRFGPNFGWNTAENSNDAISLLGSITWKSPDEKSEVYFAIQSGRENGVITVADSNVMDYSLVINHELHDDWHYMLEHDLLISNSRTSTLR